MSKPSDLRTYVFEGQRHPLSADLTHWMDASPRFTDFIDTYRDKIRKKARLNRDAQSALDLHAELEVACRLLADRRLSVAYEPYSREKGRGADFAVTYRANLVFNVEVARLRVDPGETDGIDLARKEERLLLILLSKLGQMQPAMPNLLAVRTSEDLVRSIDLPGLMQALKLAVEHKKSPFYSITRYPNPAAFFKDFLRLSALLLWGETVQSWPNKQARPLLDEKILRLVSELLSAVSTA